MCNVNGFPTTSETATKTSKMYNFSEVPRFHICLEWGLTRLCSGNEFWDWFDLCFMYPPRNGIKFPKWSCDNPVKVTCTTYAMTYPKEGNPSTFITSQKKAIKHVTSPAPLGLVIACSVIFTEECWTWSLRSLTQTSQQQLWFLPPTKLLYCSGESCSIALESGGSLHCPKAGISAFCSSGCWL